MGNLSKNFDKREFACKCGCGKSDISMELVNKLQYARTMAGIPFRITSGVRCIEHNNNVGGVDSSSHVNGYAVDIKADIGAERYMLLKYLIQAGFNRIGIAKDFIHVDCDPSKPAYVTWLY